MICRICSNQIDTAAFIVREMMYGFRDEFFYFECPSCGCVQIKEYPLDIARYYPEDYYSYSNVEMGRESFLTSYLRKQRARHCIFGRSLMGSVIAHFMKPPPMFELLKACGVGPDSRILELGSGTGGYLIKLHKLGFTNLTGLDPFLGHDVQYDDGIVVRKMSIYDVEGQYDLIIAKDTIEHMPHQISVFETINRLLTENGASMITVPLIGYAWKHYGVNWMGLDAPRHYYLHTLKSLRVVCDQTGLAIFQTRFDSDEHYFIGSEQYKMDIPLVDDRSYFKNPDGSSFSAGDIERFKAKAAELNQNQEGDHITVCMRRKISPTVRKQFEN